MKCFILNEEITAKECACIQAQCYKKKSDKELPKKVKRVVGWSAICLACKNHNKNKK